VISIDNSYKHYDGRAVPIQFNALHFKDKPDAPLVDAEFECNFKISGNSKKFENEKREKTVPAVVKQNNILECGPVKFPDPGSDIKNLEYNIDFGIRNITSVAFLEG